MLQIFFITHSKSIFWVSPKTRLPRNYKNFSGLIVELLTKFKIFANIEENGRNNRVLLMKCIKDLDEFTDFNESLNISFSTDGTLVNFNDIASRVNNFKINNPIIQKKDDSKIEKSIDEKNNEQESSELFKTIDHVLMKRHEQNRHKNITNVVVWISGVSKGEPNIDARYPIDVKVKVSKFGLSAA